MSVQHVIMFLGQVIRKQRICFVFVTLCFYIVANNEAMKLCLDYCQFYGLKICSKTCWYLPENEGYKQ